MHNKQDGFCFDEQQVSMMELLIDHIAPEEVDPAAAERIAEEACRKAGLGTNVATNSD